MRVNQERIRAAMTKPTKRQKAELQQAVKSLSDVIEKMKLLLKEASEAAHRIEALLTLTRHERDEDDEFIE
jgi:hypothetical protein